MGRKYSLLGAAEVGAGVPLLVIGLKNLFLGNIPAGSVEAGVGFSLVYDGARRIHDRAIRAAYGDFCHEKSRYSRW